MQENKSLLIRNFEARDINTDYLSWLNNKSHMQFSNQRFLEHTEDSSLNYLSSFVNSGNFFFAIEDSGLLVGTATLYRDEVSKSFDVGLLIGDKHSGKGYGKRAIHAITTLDLFRKINVTTLTAGTMQENRGMQVVLEANGFLLIRKEGLVDQFGKANCFFFYEKTLDRG
jgi:ribosomal-protein-alanine N-acetyltransferase